jgi:hypothetical protein
MFNQPAADSAAISNDCAPASRRLLSVSRVHREAGSGYQRQYRSVPAIRLNGEWLRALGFETGQKVELHATQGMIIIRSSE